MAQQPLGICHKKINRYISKTESRKKVQCGSNDALRQKDFEFLEISPQAPYGVKHGSKTLRGLAYDKKIIITRKGKTVQIMRFDVRDLNFCVISR